MSLQPTEQELAIDLFNSIRGKLVIQKAIYFGLQKMSEVTEHLREKSDIADITHLRDHHPDFNGFPDLMLDQDLQREHFEKYRKVLTCR